MSAPLMLSVHDACISFGTKPLFEQLSFNIHQGDRISLVGKNGAGKTTLMHLITGERDLDSGTRWEEKNITIGYLQQAVSPKDDEKIFDYIFSGLDKNKQNDDYKYMVQMVLEPFELDPESTANTLSGGQIRRASLARVLVNEPDILLLDEPTNHLDLTAIQWLEEYLKNYRGTLLCVSHDKTFLANISNKIFWLDRSRVRVCPKGFGHFDQWSQMLLDQEERELKKREKIVQLEVEWATAGVKARRKRNVRRLEEMKKERDKLKADKSLFNKTMNKISLAPLEAAEVSKMITEFYNVSKTFVQNNKSTIILNKFNFRIMKGDKIGILGKNGSGKTSFLKMLLGQLKPDSGTIKIARNIEIAYFDQNRSTLNEKHSLWQTLCPDGGDHVVVGGKKKHVCGYLKDFLFDPKQATDLVSTLSGGQKNRLMLAKTLANPGNLLILDEPTNDLDMETLEMLEEILAHYSGTLFVVSHDRDFLDQTVTKTLAFEGGGKVDSYIGGYSDYIEAISHNHNPTKQNPTKNQVKEKKLSSFDITSTPSTNTSNNIAAKKLSYKLQYELDNLPVIISKLEQEIEMLHHTMADPDLYTRDNDQFQKISSRLITAEEELEKAELRWLELIELKESL